MSTDTSQGRIYADFNGLANLRAQARQDSPETLRLVAKQFEAHLVQQLVRSGRDANLDNGILDNKGSAMYQDMYDKQIALSATEGKGLGIAEMIVKQVEQAQGAVSASTGETAGRQGSETKNQASTATALENRLASPISKSNAAQAKKSARAHTHEGPLIDMGLAFAAPAGPTPTRFDSAGEFVRAVMPHARRVGAELGVDPKLLVAQAALETGWGKSIIRNGDGSSSHNLFNIKAHGGWEGDVASTRTTEFVNGAKIKIRDGFRSYDSFADSFRDYVDFLHENPRYGDALKQTDDPAAFARALQTAGYATDPKYADKILSIYRKDELQTVVT